MTCKYCEKDQPIYDKKCKGCRKRLVMVEWCKIWRKEMVDELEKQYEPIEGWKEPPHCGCDNKCKRRSKIKKNEQQTNISRKTTSRSR